MKFVLIIISVILLLGGVFMISNYGGFSNIKYEKYSSKDPELNITMDYISGWKYSEHRGSYGSYTQVQFIEPPVSDKNLPASIIATVKSISKVYFKPPTLENAVDDTLTKRLKFEASEVLSKSEIKLLGTDAMDIELAYKTLDKPYSVDAKLIPVKERIIIFKKNEKFYIVRYLNTEEEFAKFSKAFNHCVNTLRLKN